MVKDKSLFGFRVGAGYRIPTREVVRLSGGAADVTGDGDVLAGANR
jgi:hypothetical protein